jgi:hypothetical protein
LQYCSTGFAGIPTRTDLVNAMQPIEVL